MTRARAKGYGKKEPGNYLFASEVVKAAQTTADVSIRKLASHVSSASTFTYSSSFSFIWISLHFKAENRSFDLGRRVKS